MRFVVFVKQVPDTYDVPLDENGSLMRAGVPSILNPYCEQALCSMLSLRRAGDTVSAVTMGPPGASEALRRCLELGADDATLLTDRDFAGADTHATSRVLAAYVGRFEQDADLLVFGRQAIDGDTGQVPASVAQLLAVQQFSYTTGLEADADGFVAHQDYDAFRRVARVPRGSVVSFGTVDPNGHLPTAEMYLEARSKEIRTLGRVDIGLGLYSVGLRGSLTRIVSTETVKSSRKGMKVEITDPAKAAEFILRESEAVR